MFNVNRKPKAPFIINDIMSLNVKTYHMDMPLDVIAADMLSFKCRAVMIVDDYSKPIGIILDRDIELVCKQKNIASRELVAKSIVQDKELYICLKDDNVDIALAIMNDRKVSRLPVTDNQGTLVGMLSITEIECCLEKGLLSEQVSYDFALYTIKAIAS